MRFRLGEDGARVINTFEVFMDDQSCQRPESVSPLFAENIVGQDNRFVAHVIIVPSDTLS